MDAEAVVLRDLTLHWDERFPLHKRKRGQSRIAGEDVPAPRRNAGCNAAMRLR